ncbi:hypothetical protein Gpo141_00004647 [Globisporangium polare]
MEQCTPSWPKVVPTHVETLADNHNKPCGDCVPRSPEDIKLDATLEATLPGTLRSRLVLQPTATNTSDAISTAEDGGVVTPELRRAKSFSEWSMARATHQTSGQLKLRRHSSGMTRSRPTTVAMAQEPGESFYDVFGSLGVPMVLAFVFSAAAMFSQACVQMYPSDFANLLMNTTHYDEGEFWLLDKTKLSTVAIATAMLLFFGCCYLVLVACMLFFRHWAIEKKPNNSVQQDALLRQKRKEAAGTTSTITRESTATEGEEEITVGEIAKGVLLTNYEFLRDALAAAFSRLLSKQQSPQSTVTGDADAAVQRRKAAMARRKLQRARDLLPVF